jgi:hypothetical protein
MAVTLLAGGALAAAVSAPVAVAASAHARPASLASAKSAASRRSGQSAGRSAREVRLYAVQNRLDAAVRRILTAGGGGNASVVVDPRRASMRVYWHGTVPARIRRLAGRLGVRVRFAPAAFTFNRLIAAEHTLAGKPGLVQAAPKPDGSGLNVMVTRATPARDRAAMRAASPVPLTITTGTPLQLTATRQADVSPYWGGSRYQNTVTGDYCSNGFALAKTPSVYELTAGHCGANTNTVRIPGQIPATGTMQQKFACRDIIQINYSTSGGLVEGRIYTLGADSRTSVPVGGATFDTVGDQIVTGGARTGQHSNITVTAVGAMAPVTGIPCKDVYPLDEGVQNNGGCAAAPGDSGGPVYSYTATDAVLGRGTMTGGFGEKVTCSGTGTTTIQGSDSVAFAPLVSPPGSSYIGSLAWYGTTVLNG